MATDPTQPSPQEMRQETSPPALGRGGLFQDGNRTYADKRLLERALAEQWEIPEQFYRMAPLLAGKVAFGLKNPDDPKSEPLYGARNALNALRALVAMQAQNIGLDAQGRPLEQRGGLTIQQIVLQVEEQRRTEVIDDEWLAKRIGALQGNGEKPEEA